MVSNELVELTSNVRHRDHRYYYTDHYVFGSGHRVRASDKVHRHHNNLLPGKTCCWFIGQPL
jgi:hypothetical protein